MTASIGSILSVARTALTAHQAAIGVVSHNIANATTDGYSRQRAELIPGRPLNTPVGGVGTGVFVADIGRLRDRILDHSYREETSGSGYWNRRASVLGEVEALHGDITTGNLPAALDSFWNAWSDLSNDPTSSTARVVVRQAGEQVVQQLRRLSTGIDRVGAGVALRLGQEVGDINRIATEIGALNVQIVAAEAGGSTAADLRDARDRAIDRLASFANVNVAERSSGSVGVSIAGVNIVDGAEVTRVVANTSGGVWTLRSERGVTFSPVGGSVGAAMDVLNGDLPAAKAQLDTLARSLAEAVNGVHRTGMNAAGQTDVLFFDDQGDPTTITAQSLSLSAAVRANAQAIAAGTPATDAGTGLPTYGAGRNDVALALGSLRDAPVASLGGRSIADSYASQVSDLGAEIRAARDAVATHDVLASQAELRRSSVSGVSIDEELVQLIRFQNAYSAAARLVTTADEMLQTILDMKR